MSVPSERIFSKLGHVANNLRNYLRPENVYKLAFLSFFIIDFLFDYVVLYINCYLLIVMHPQYIILCCILIIMLLQQIVIVAIFLLTIIVNETFKNRPSLLILSCSHVNANACKHGIENL